MRPVDIQSMFLKATMEIADDKPQRDLTQPEAVWRENRQRLEAPFIMKAFNSGCVEAPIPCIHVFTVVENNLDNSISVSKTVSNSEVSPTLVFG